MRDFIAIIVALVILSVLIHIFEGYRRLQIDTQIGIYFTLMGIIFSWSFIEKSKKHFFGYVLPFWLVIGLLLFNKYLEGYYFILAAVGIPFGYVLYRLGLIDLFNYLDKTYSEKTKNVTLRWLVIYYRCRLKKLNVYLNDGNNIKQAIIISIVENSDFLTIYYCDTITKNIIIEEEATLDFFDELAKEKLLINPDMEIFIFGQANEKTVFWLVNFLLESKFKKVGFLSATSMNNMINNLKEPKNDRES